MSNNMTTDAFLGNRPLSPLLSSNIEMETDVATYLKDESHAKLKVDDGTISTLIFFEGCSNTPYPDAGGVMTVGIGTIKLHDGTKVTDKTVLSNQEIFDEAKYFITKKVDPVISKTITRELKDHEKWAIQSAVYNLGPGILQNAKGQPTPLAIAINKGDTNTVAMLLGKHHYVKGKNVDGLRVRRYMETALYEGKITLQEMENFYLCTYGKVSVAKLYKHNGLPNLDDETLKYVKTFCSTKPKEEDIKKWSWFGYGKHVYEFEPNKNGVELSKAKQQTATKASPTVNRARTR